MILRTLFLAESTFIENNWKIHILLISGFCETPEEICPCMVRGG